MKYLSLAWFLVAMFPLASALAEPPRGAQKDEPRLAPPPAARQADPGLEARVWPEIGIVLPIDWEKLVTQLTAAGGLDREKFAGFYRKGGKLDAQAASLLDGTDNGSRSMTRDNASLLLNLLWAFGLGNKSEILEQGDMQAPRFGGAGRFASTGGWTLARGDAMEHFSRHRFVYLDAEQTRRVARVAAGIYRPCCGNPTLFPDCNHGMAMLGLLELLAARDFAESEMYRIALAVSSYWFPDAYLTIARYVESKQGLGWEQVVPVKILGAEYSSASGYRRIVSEMTPVSGQSGTGCAI